MSNHVCPWWLGYLIALPLRRCWQDPHWILAPHVREGMTVLEPGPGMGFFSLELARLVGATGKVIAVDIQPKMLNVLARRARKVGLAERIVLREPRADSLAIDDLAGQVDFVLAFAVVHELPDMPKFFQEAARCLKSGGHLLLCEPSGHVKQADWETTLETAKEAGLYQEMPLSITRSHAALLKKA
jgi:ubiquinone/menaquinone biosynthesis C-methylase UbiE